MLPGRAGRRLPKVAEVERLTVRPGDRLVLRCPRELDDAEVAELKANLAAAFKGADWKPPVLLLEGDMQIAVLGPEEAP